MYDTVFFRLSQDDVNGVDFCKEIPRLLSNVGEHCYKGFLFITGELDGLKVTANSYQVRVKDGSLCKYLLGDNFQTLGRRDTQRAMEKLSDALHLPMGKAIVTRMDVAQNFIVKYPPEVYINHLGALRYASRLQEPSGLYYSLNGGRLCFYDKNREQKSKHGEIPDLFIGRNVLRYERRYTKRITAKFGVEVTGEMLYDEAFYMGVLNKWKADYQAIQKINDISINFQAMKTKKQLYKMGVLSLVEQAGGQVEMINQINEALQRGELDKKQAFDLRAAVNDACDLKVGLTSPNDAIQELDKKVAEAVRCYR